MKPQHIKNASARCVQRLFHPRKTTLAVLIHVVLFGGIAISMTVPQNSAWAQTAASAQYSFNVPAGDLENGLNQLARQAGITMSFNPAVVKGKTHSVLQGSFTITQGLQLLLQGSGLQAVPLTNGAYGLQVIHANDSNEATLPVVNVNSASGLSGTTEGTGSYTATGPIASATKLGLTLRETPQSMTVMTRQRLEDQNITTLSQALQQAPGVSVMNVGAFAETAYQIRGFGVSHLRDGVSIGSGDSYTLLPTADLEIYDRVEVVRGPAGLMEGTSGSLGGAVNLVRRRPDAEPGGTFSVSAGSWNNYRASASVHGALNDDKTVRGRMVVVHQDRGYFYNTSKAHTSTIYGIVETDLSPRTVLTVSGSYSRGDSMPFYGLPANGGGFARSTFIAPSWTKVRVNGKFEGLAELEHKLENDWKIKATAVYQDGTAEGQLGVPLGMNAVTQTTASVYGYKFQRKDQTAGIEVSASGPFELFGRKHELVLGANWNEVRSDVGDASKFWVGPYSISDPANLAVSLNDFASVDNARKKTVTTRSSVFAVSRFKLLDPLTLITGAQFTSFDEKTRGAGLVNNSGWTTSDARASFEFTPYAGLIWDISKNLSWYASYADIFEPQTQKDWQQKTLKPRVGWQVETGVKGEFFDGRLNASVAVFRIRDTNRAVRDTDPTHNFCGTNGIDPCVTAGGLQQTQGWEAEISGNLTPNWNIAGSYTRSDSQILAATDPTTIGRSFAANTPRHMLRAWTTYRFDNTLFNGAMNGWHVGGGITAQSSLRNHDAWDNTWSGGWTVFSLQAGYRFSPKYQLSLSVNNLFDKHYFPAMGSGDSSVGSGDRWFYGEPRNVMLSLRGNF